MQGGDTEGHEGYAHISLHSISFSFPLNELMKRECKIKGTLFSSKFVLFTTRAAAWSSDAVSAAAA